MKSLIKILKIKTQNQMFSGDVFDFFYLRLSSFIIILLNIITQRDF